MQRHSLYPVCLFTLDEGERLSQKDKIEKEEKEKLKPKVKK
jgi:hypothetical protein